MKISRSIINDNFDLVELKEPYPVWIIDNFLNEHVLRMIHELWPSLKDNPVVSVSKNISFIFF